MQKAATPLFNSKTPHIIVNEIKMMQAAFSGAHVLLEGDSDVRFWKPHLHSSRTNVVDCEGKPNLLSAAGMLSGTSVPFTGVYDPDFDRHRNITHFPGTLVQTDLNNLEATLVSSHALSVMLGEFADAKMVEDFVATAGCSVADHIEMASSIIGKLRYLSTCLNHNVDFKSLSLRRFLKPDWMVDRQLLIEGYAGLSMVGSGAIEDMLSAYCSPGPKWHYSRGHDCICLLAYGLRYVIGRKQISEDDISKILRIAFPLQSLHDSGMYRGLKLQEVSLRTPIFN